MTENDAYVTTPARSEAPSGTEPRRRRRAARGGWSWLLLPALSVITVVALIAAVWGWVAPTRERDQQQQLADTRSEVLREASALAKNLTSYHHERLDEDFKRVTDRATGEFKKQYQDFADNLAKTLRDNKATSEGSVREAGLKLLQGDEASVLLFVDQKVTNANTPTPRTDRNRILMKLQQVNGKWYVEKLEVV